MSDELDELAPKEPPKVVKVNVKGTAVVTNHEPVKESDDGAPS